MGFATTSATITDLRTRIAALEQNPALTENGPDQTQTEALLGAAPKGTLHEVWSDSFTHTSALNGFSLGQAKSLLTPKRLAIIWLHLGHEATEMGLPYGAGVKNFGLEPDCLIIGRMATITDLLWAIEEAVACAAIAAVIADIGTHHKALDFTASRRLNLRANAAGASIFLQHYGPDREASAATYRWHIAPTLSTQAPFDHRAPGTARWQVTLEKGAKGNRNHWHVNWTENGFAIDQDKSAHHSQTAGHPPALSGLPSAALGDRLPETA